ncbi:Apolipoprotein N-acyltransferase / Copper homeostasis protein CutE [hydrothermal vent metagenome]|uniref:Apolipoprotein N-acyltransferase / Copper homeostasis protein CutE n=1 Tax=hydrothermal vent metagenome TaxID=652676 RepID=A0A3B0RM14_9ZZZZ
MLKTPNQLAFFDNLSKWQRRAIIFFSGIVASMALPPADIWPAVFVAFSTLVILLDAIERRALSPTKKFKAAFACGWLFGFGYFVVSLYWIGAALLVEADKFAVLLPLAVAALPAGIALFWGLATGFAVLAWRPGLSRILVLAVAFTLTEWLRGWVLTGFPWNTIGYTSAGMGGIDQLASFTGLYGVTFFVLVCAMAPALLFSRRRNFIMAGFLFASFAALWIGGNFYKDLNRDNRPAAGPVIRVVQPNIDQRKKWDRAFRQANIEKYFQLSALDPASGSAPGKRFDALIWPESALPLLFDESPLLQARVADILPPDTVLIMGALRRERKVTSGEAQNEFFNSVQAVDSEGKVVATYDKFHLVPFGEYLPGEEWLTPLGLRKIVAIPGGFTSGPGPQTLKAGTLPDFSPLVCYEIGFPGQVVDQNNRPGWIVNVTNDGWFGKTAGPYQHLAQARFRAIEQGLPIVRAANTGISAVIDPFGKIVDSIQLGTSGIMDVKLPNPREPTVYTRYGNWAAVAQIVGMLIILSSLSTVFGLFGMRGKRQ